MEQVLTCPTCKSNYEKEPVYCDHCGYPFAGTETEKSKFVAQQILNKGKISGTKDRIKRARIILWVLAGVNAIIPFITHYGSPEQPLNIVFGLSIAALFGAFGFLTYRRPFVAILIPLILVVVYYVLITITDPYNLVRGILWKGLILFGLIYALNGIIESRRIKKTNAYLNKFEYNK